MSKQRKQSIDWHSQLLESIYCTSLATDFQNALTILIDGAGSLIPCSGVSVMWLEGDRLKVVANGGTTAPLQGLTLPASQMGIAQAALDSGRPVMVGNAAEDKRWRPVPGEQQVSSWLGVPLVLEDRTIGLIEWTDRSQARFDGGDVGRAEELARHTAPILYRTSLLDDTLLRLQELAEPRPATTPEPVDLTADLRLVVQEAIEFTNARHAFVFLQGNGGGQLRCVAAGGDRRDRLSETVLRGDGSLTGWDMSTAYSADWLRSDPSDREVMTTLGIEHSLVMPVRVGQEKVGILGVAEPRGGRTFGRNDIQLMTHLASQVSVVVERFYRHKPHSTVYDYETTLQASPLGMAILTVNGEIEVCNPALASLLSRSDLGLVGHNLARFLEPDDSCLLQSALEEIAITGGRRQVEARVDQTQGNYRHTRMSLAYARVSDDARGNVLAIVEDVSSLKILEEERVEHLRELRLKHAQLQELDQLKSRFVSNVSHELRTPLAVIKLYATLARKGRPEKQRFYLQTIEQETHRLETMVENILDLSRLDRHSLRVEPELLDVGEIVTQVMEVYRETAEKRDVALRNRVRPGLPKLWADKNHLIQMLTNLLDNALKFAHIGSEVWVSARESGRNSGRVLEVAVGDRGQGIPDDEQARVFERFYRGSNNDPGSTGTGLGLAIVREIMEQHGGTVTLESKVGEGSVFTLKFPIQPPDAPQSS